jgi:protoporphyrinogen oxidase
MAVAPNNGLTDESVAFRGNRRVAVIGGGVLGLETARRLSLAGCDVTVFDSGELGGLVAAHRVAGLTIDRYYHVILGTDRRTLAMVDALGLSDQLAFGSTRTGVRADGQLHSVSSAIEYLRFPALGLVAKARLAATILGGSRISDGRRMEQIPLEQWLVRWSGRSTFQRFWLPLLRAKTGDAWQRMSAAFVWSTIVRLMGARRADLGAEQFGYVRGGYAVVVDAFVRILGDRGVVLEPGVAITSVAPRDDGSLEVAAAERTWIADEVVFTTGPGTVARAVTDLTDAERARFAAVDQVGVVCVALVVRRPLSHFYLTYLTDGDVPFTAVVEWTALASSADYDGHHIVYLPRYAESTDPRFDQSDAAIIAEFTAGLQRLHPTLTEDDIAGAAVSRARAVYAVPTLNFSATMPPITTGVAGVYAISAANLAYATLNVDDTLSLVDRYLAERVSAGGGHS